MFYQEIPFNFGMKREATGNTTFTIKTLPWREGDIVTIDGVSVCCVDSNNVVSHVGISSHELTHYVETLLLAKATYFYLTSRPFHINSDDRIVVQIVSPTQGDKFVVNVWGRLRVCVT